MACSGRFADAEDYANLLCAGINLNDYDAVLTINNALELAAADIHAAMAATGACDCTLAPWALAFLKKLNVIDAAVLQNCPCGNRLSDERKQQLLEWLERQYELIRTGKTILCAGDSGVDFPAVGTAEFTYTGWNTVDIIINERRRHG